MRRPLDLRAAALIASAACVLGACASPEPRYYTLACAHELDGAAAIAPIAVHGSEAIAIEVSPVRVPERLNRPQLILNNNDGTLRLLEQDRWAAPLPDELREGLSRQLERQLGAVDTYRKTAFAKASAYRVSAELGYMDLTPDKRFAGGMQWTLQRLADKKIVSGRTRLAVPVDASINAMVQAARRLLSNTAADIAVAARGMKTTRSLTDAAWIESADTQSQDESQ
jgi:uncharacterized lipoprotein YmbA